MSLGQWLDHPSEALVRAMHHWDLRHPVTSAQGQSAPAYCIALSREVGARGTTVARAIGQRLGWPVYDHELLERIAHRMNVDVGLVEDVDECHVNWLQQCIENFGHAPNVSEGSYLRHLVEMLIALGAQGRSIIVGRGAAFVLPAATTLRVRLVANQEDRISVMRQERGVSRVEAARFVETTDRQRKAFIKEHFHKDPTDVSHYHLVLNTSLLSVEQCANLALESLEELQRRAAEWQPVLSPA